MHKNRDEVLALLEAADIHPNVKAMFQDILSLDTATLSKIHAGTLADGLRNEGARFLMKEDGSFKSYHDFGLSAYIYEKIIDAADKQKLVSTLTTGKDLFGQLSEKPETVKDLEKICDWAPLHIKHGYISAAYSALAAGGRPRTVLQYAVNYSVGVGETGISAEEAKREHTNFWGAHSRLTDHIKKNVSYVAKPLGLEPRAQDASTRQHPAIKALEKFIRGLPHGQAFDLAAASAQPKTLDEKLARPLTSKEQETANALNKFFEDARKKKAALNAPSSQP